MFIVMWVFLGAISVALRVVTVTTLQQTDYRIKDFLEDSLFGLVLGPIMFISSILDIIHYSIKNNFTMFKAKKD